MQESFICLLYTNNLQILSNHKIYMHPVVCCWMQIMPYGCTAAVAAATPSVLVSHWCWHIA
jgi:hypothetical protein